MRNVVAFDLDDTLYSELDYVKSGLRRVSELIGIRTGVPPEKMVHTAEAYLRANGRNGVLDHMLSQVPPASRTVTVQDLLYVYRSHVPSLRLADSTRAVLEQLKECHTLALITDGCLSTQMRKVEALKLDGLIDQIIYTDVLGREYWKPSRFAFEFLRGECGDLTQYCYVGDNPEKDFLGAKQSSFRTVMLLSEQNKNAWTTYPDRYQPEFRIRSLMELPELVNSLFSSETVS
jgi:putative hydrolase of the HAD superfamily